MDESTFGLCELMATHKVNKAETTEAEQHHTPGLHGNRKTQKDQISYTLLLLLSPIGGQGLHSCDWVVEFLLKQRPEPIAGQS